MAKVELSFNADCHPVSAVITKGWLRKKYLIIDRVEDDCPSYNYDVFDLHPGGVNISDYGNVYWRGGVTYKVGRWVIRDSDIVINQDLHLKLLKALNSFIAAEAKSRSNEHLLRQHAEARAENERINQEWKAKPKTKLAKLPEAKLLK